MNKIATIAGLTWKAAFRYRLFWILCALLAGAVLGLPLLIKDDGTAQGMVQILLTYTLSATATLLGFATLWLSCGTLAKDVEECQVQMVAGKPIARYDVGTDPADPDFRVDIESALSGKFKRSGGGGRKQPSGGDDDDGPEA